MKNARISVFLILFVLLISVPAVAPASDEQGFRGISWGADISAHTEMRRISCEGSFCSYVRSGEDLSMNDAMISSVTYRTFKNRFVEVSIEALAETLEERKPGPESANFLAFRQACHDSFGPTSFAASFEYLRAEQYRWEQTGVRKVLKINFNKNHMLLSIMNHDLLKQLNVEAEEIPEDSGIGHPGAPPALSGKASGEGSPALTDELDGKTGEPARPAEAGKKTLPGFGKAGKLLRWIFVNDEPSAAPEADIPGMNTH